MEICWKPFDILIHSSNKLKSKDSSKESNKNEVNDGDDDEGDEISVPMIIVFFILVCTFLVLLYFFYEYLGKYMYCARLIKWNFYVKLLYITSHIIIHVSSDSIVIKIFWPSLDSCYFTSKGWDMSNF